MVQRNSGWLDCAVFRQDFVYAIWAFDIRLRYTRPRLTRFAKLFMSDLSVIRNNLESKIQY